MNALSNRDAILLVAYGSSANNGLNFYKELELEIHARYPSFPVMWATASDSLPDEEFTGKSYTVAEAISQLDILGVTRLVILPLYTVPGSAYEKLEHDLENIFSTPMENLKKYALAAPLLHEARDADVVSQALLDSLPDEDECPDRILFMGHGSRNEAGNAAYEDVDDLLDRTYPGARLALLKGDSFETLLAEWGDADAGETVLLRPFFFTIGQHSLEDLSGNAPQSWKSRLEELGYTCETQFISLGDMPLIRDLLIAHIEEAYEGLVGF